MLNVFIKSILVILIVLPNFCNSQSFENLSNVDVDDLTDKQVESFVQKAESSGLTFPQLELLAKQRGMSSLQIKKLKNRISNLQGIKQDKDGIASSNSRLREDYSRQDRSFSFDVIVQADSIEKDELAIFGAEIFESSLVFEPSENAATPNNYVLGVGDELIIDIYGASETTYRQLISPEGKLLISGVGPISLAGLTIAQAKIRILDRLSTIYSGLKGRNPNTFLQLSLGNISTIKVNVVGNVKRPGTYSISSFSSAFNALYAAGGPSQKGSMRNIEIIRDQQKIATLDIYKYFYFGESDQNPQLRDEDILVVKSYQNRVKLTGRVKQPAIYELIQGETIRDLMHVSGGILPNGNGENLNIFRVEGGRKTIKSIDSGDGYEKAVLLAGDSINVSPIPSYFSNYVRVEGAVQYPGYYELSELSTLSNLLKRVKVDRNAFRLRGNIIRLNNDLSLSNVTFNIDKVASGNEDIALKEGDLVRVASIFEVEEQENVKILGEVKREGTYPYIDGMTVEDLVTISGGLLSSANTTSVEVARRVSKDSKEFRTAFLFDFSIAENLEVDTTASNFELKPFDVVTIKASALFRVQKTVRIEGEVMKPGLYVLETEEDKITDLIDRAGGLTTYAYPKGASLIRNLAVKANVTTETSFGDRYRKAQLESFIERDSLDEIGELLSDMEGLGIELDKALDNPESEYNVILQGDDVISIPKQLQTVRVRGEVLYPTRVQFEQSTSFREYISLSGGFSDRAKKSKAYVVYPNGRARKTKTFLWMKFYPNVEPGSDIFVPQQEIKQKMSVQEILGITSSLATIALIINQLSN